MFFQEHPKVKRQPTEWDKGFANDIPDKEFISRIYKLLLKLNDKKTNNPILIRAKDQHRHFFKEDICIEERKRVHMDTCT